MELISALSRGLRTLRDITLLSLNFKDFRVTGSLKRCLSYFKARVGVTLLSLLGRKFSENRFGLSEASRLCRNKGANPGCSMLKTPTARRTLRCSLTRLLPV